MTQNISAQSAHLLLVEDVQLNRDLAVILLEREGYKVTAIDNALDALEAMAKSSFAGILMDIRMPGMDGLTAVSIIRACERGQAPAEDVAGDLAKRLTQQLLRDTTPIIVMTASSAEQEKDRGLTAGADVFLRKPFNPKQLLLAVEKVLNLPTGNID